MISEPDLDVTRSAVVEPQPAGPPESADSMNYLEASRVAEKFGKIEESEDLLRTAVSRFPNVLGLRIELAWLLNRRRDWHAAIEVWRVVQEQAPHHVAGFIGQCVSLRDSGRLDEAEVVCRSAIRGMPGEKSLFLEFAGIAELRGDWTEALTRWHSIRQLFPNEPAGWLRGGKAAARAERTNDSLSMFAEAERLFPQHVQVLTNCADAAFHRGDYQEAVRLGRLLTILISLRPVGHFTWRDPCEHCDSLRMPNKY